ncbi:MAG: T9SS C-terminal target domain-containing protein [bacterium TMED46]|nr:MAG: T9SS C-terminal target domain-containing protein [bacterium TMED46]
MHSKNLLRKRPKGLRCSFIGPFIFTYLFCGHPISIDGKFEDWVDVPVAYNDTEGDGLSADYSSLKITYDSQFLFIYFNFYNGDFLMQDWNDFHLYIDADNDSSTGYFVHGIGAELDWTFGNRSGYKYFDGQQTELYQNDLTLRIAPTITSTEFEIAIARDSAPLTMNGSQSLNEGTLVFSEIEEDGDLVPDESGGIPFSIGDDIVPLPQPITLERSNEQDIRLVSYNTWNEGILDSDRQIHFKRILQALDPDVIALQEHGDWNDIENIIQSWFPSEEWHASWTYNDLVVLSRFPITHDANMISSERTMAALLDTEDELGKDLLIFNSHLSCCDNNEGRQQQVDEFAGVWRDWVTNESGPFALEYGTPFVHVGDFNYVGYRQQVETIRDGDIEDEVQYGNDFLPDWDSTAIIDLFPRHTHKRMGYTWRKDGSSFNPGKLDYVFYSDATIDTAKYYILNTLAMDDIALDYHELQWDDTQVASDHLPLVLDISLNDDVGINQSKIVPISTILYPNYPNPFNSRTVIPIYLQDPGMVELSIVDVKGRFINRLIHGNRQKGNLTINWDGTNDKGQNVNSGVYFYLLKLNGISHINKMIFLK